MAAAAGGKPSGEPTAKLLLLGDSGSMVADSSGWCFGPVSLCSAGVGKSSLMQVFADEVFDANMISTAG